MKLFQQLHSDWQDALSCVRPNIDAIEQELGSRNFLPRFDFVFRALQMPISHGRVVIVGQDPYPNPDFACGFSFSIPPEVPKIPMSLQNILKEVVDDVGATQVRGGDLTPWVDQGVVLLNRVLTLDTGASNSHAKLGWEEVTNEAARVLNEHGAIFILWGKSAGELSQFTDPLRTISGVHPSPLSAYRGFFGSKPFSKVNEILRASGETEIIW
jgi:uracil-DNA glycosylase